MAQASRSEERNVEIFITSTELERAPTSGRPLFIFRTVMEVFPEPRYF